MRTYRPLPGIEQHLLKTLRELKIKPKDPSYTPTRAIKLRHRFYMTPVVPRRGKIVWFKARLELAPGLKRSLDHEIGIQRLFGEYEKKHRPRFDSPSFLQAGGRGDYRWLLRKYWVGDFAGDMVHAYGFTPSFLRRVSPKRAAHALQDVQAMTGMARGRLQLHHHDRRWYDLDFRHYHKYFYSRVITDKLNPGWSAADVKRLGQHFKKYAAVLRSETTSFSHGDLYPNNAMLVGKQSKIVLFDWELANWNLPTFDSVMLYLLAWQRPAWQKKFREASQTWLGTSRRASQSWHLAQLSLATRFAGFAFIRLRNVQPGRYPKLPKAHQPKILRFYLHMIKHVAESDQYLLKSK